jgi:23S rRNA (adenine2503-C2)-methyltransferase
MNMLFDVMLGQKQKSQLKLTKRLDDPSGIVSKLVFEDESSIVETVVYQYQNRGVICFSCQSGCPIGCTFCGTGKKFIRNLDSSDMMLQIEAGRSIIGNREKIQLMSMSMGEPMLNWDNVELIAEHYLKNSFYFYISTIGIKNGATINRILSLGDRYKKFGLQISLHAINDENRKKIIPAENGLQIESLIFLGRIFCLRSGNRAYYNYIMKGNESEEEQKSILNFLCCHMNEAHHVTFSVLCNTKELSKSDPALAIKMANKLFELNSKIETSAFDPAGQDTIGGGCGQLLYVQERLNRSTDGRCA